MGVNAEHSLSCDTPCLTVPPQPGCPAGDPRGRATAPIGQRSYARVAAGPVWIAHHPLQSLTGCAPRKIFHEDDGMNALQLAIDALIDPVAQLVFAERVSLSEDHGGRRRLAPFLAGNTEHGGFAHCWVLYDNLFDVSGKNIAAAANDQVLHAIDQEEKTVFIYVTQVARMQPAVDNRLLS